MHVAGDRMGWQGAGKTLARRMLLPGSEPECLSHSYRPKIIVGSSSLWQIRCHQTINFLRRKTRVDPDTSLRSKNADWRPKIESADQCEQKMADDERIGAGELNAKISRLRFEPVPCSKESCNLRTTWICSTWSARAIRTDWHDPWPNEPQIVCRSPGAKFSLPDDLIPGYANHS